MERGKNGTMKEFDTKKFCEDLIRSRGQQTKQDFAEKLGINCETLLLLETGKQNPSLDVLSEICRLNSSQPTDYFQDCDSGVLCYLVGSLEKGDRDKLISMVERIRIKEKYDRLAKYRGGCELY